MTDTHAIIQEKFPKHPFADIPESTNIENLLLNFFAMSQAFPYIQSGTQRDLSQHFIDRNECIPEHVELTTVVANFLCWDETGGFNLLLASGLKSLPRILETKRFHSNLLKKDLQHILQKDINPDYSPVTKTYLDKLFKGLSQVCPVSRTAYMLGFEMHANDMITALWESISTRYQVNKNKLAYFHTHVGGDDPAEAYHVLMTSELIKQLVPEDRNQEFIDMTIEAYQLNYDWCQALVNH
ncbi:MAG TPA: hypothetical protein VL360_01615 [Gammaproteobacteria bacterium]|jgi:hypothetical protein|nr:hypothetical protein [Gammaproteobacteria bacterium]